MKKFATIVKLAEKRKGGSKQLARLLPKVQTIRQLNAKSDDRYLSAMARCINQAGFNWSVVDKKWPQFEEAFLGFDPDKLLYLSPEKWEAFVQDTRVVRNWQKISAVRDNASFVAAMSKEHNGFGRFLSQWPPSDQIGLMSYLKKWGSRLGGQTCQWFLRNVRKDGFIITKDVVLALQSAGVDLKDNPTCQTEYRRIQEAFNEWHEQSSLPYTHISKIAAYSAGTNYPNERIFEEMKKL